MRALGSANIWAVTMALNLVHRFISNGLKSVVTIGNEPPAFKTS
jgi:hypothetical protein